MTTGAFSYTTYINVTPERLWQALTQPALTNLWWGTAFETDWAPGSPMEWHAHGSVISDPAQTVLASDPPRRLSYPWHAFTPQWAERAGIDEDLRAQLGAERRTKVTYEIEAVGTMARLTLVHDDFEPGGVMISMCSDTWPLLLSSLKTLLETDEPLPDPDQAPHTG